MLLHLYHCVACVACVHSFNLYFKARNILTVSLHMRLLNITRLLPLALLNMLIFSVRLYSVVSIAMYVGHDVCRYVIT